MNTLIIGLGNPGAPYRGTYHNVGQEFANFIAAREALPWRHTPLYDYATWEVGGVERIVAKTNVFMNESGKAVREAMRTFHIRSSELLVVHDDTDLSLGVVKMALGRGAAGHKGVLSVIHALNTREFKRLRIGVRPPTSPARGREKAGDFVLKKMSREAREKLQSAFVELASTVIENDARPSSRATSEPMGN
jgi:PTH1 family peptidyl-tRNA hydrolase